jgi:hypothetical protein
LQRLGPDDGEIGQKGEAEESLREKEEPKSGTEGG